MGDPDLAIVIPAYKGRFLRQALLEAICERFATSRELVYRRLAGNLGRKALTQQWNRCVALSCEPWVCLFGDDDEFEPACVAAFHSARKQARSVCHVYRFNVSIIDERRIREGALQRPATHSRGHRFPGIKAP